MNNKYSCKFEDNPTKFLKRSTKPVAAQSTENAENIGGGYSCKRCGVIFVHSESQKNINGNVRWRNNLRTFSFIVVRGKESNIWSFPKGRMSAEDSREEDCAIREVYEETGIQLKSIEGMPRIVIGKNVYFICHTTKEDFNSFTIHDNYEVGEVCWKTSEELRKVVCNKDLRAILKYPYYKQHFHGVIFQKMFPLRNTMNDAEKIVRYDQLNLDHDICCEEIVTYNSETFSPISKSIVTF